MDTIYVLGMPFHPIAGGEGEPATGTEAPPAPAPNTADSGAPTEGGESAPEGDKTPATPAPKETPPQAATVDEEAHWAWLETQDPDEIAKRNRKVAGKIGELAQKQARGIRDSERKAEAVQLVQKAQSDLDRELDEAIQSRDALKVLELMEKRQSGRNEQQMAESHRQAVWGEVDAALEVVFNQLPDEIQKQLSGKQYQAETLSQARTLFVQDLIEHLSEHKGNSKLTGQLKDLKKQWEADWEKERLPALKQDWLSEQNAGAPSPETDGAAPAPGELTAVEFNNHIKDTTWRRENKDRIDAYLAKQVAARRR